MIKEVLTFSTKEIDMKLCYFSQSSFFMAFDNGIPVPGFRQEIILQQEF